MYGRTARNATIIFLIRRNIKARNRPKTECHIRLYDIYYLIWSIKTGILAQFLHYLI